MRAVEMVVQPRDSLELGFGGLDEMEVEPLLMNTVFNLAIEIDRIQD